MIFQSERLNLLVGAGLTSALAHAAGAKTGAAGMTGMITTSDRALNEALEDAAKESASRALRGGDEDRLRVALATLPGLRLIGDCRADELDEAIGTALRALAGQIAESEHAILHGATWGTAKPLSGFLRSFASRVPTRDRLHVFTTNYDRVLEWGAEQSGLRVRRVVDRFVGTLRPVFVRPDWRLTTTTRPRGASGNPTISMESSA